MYRRLGAILTGAAATVAFLADFASNLFADPTIAQAVSDTSWGPAAVAAVTVVAAHHAGRRAERDLPARRGVELPPVLRGE